MSDILLIMPDGWTKLVYTEEWLREVGDSTLEVAINQNNLADLSAMFESGGFIPPGARVTEVRYIRTDDSYMGMEIYFQWLPE